MLLCGAVRLAADRCSSRLGRGPDDSFPARPPTHAVGHQLSVTKGSTPADKNPSAHACSLHRKRGALTVFGFQACAQLEVTQVAMRMSRFFTCPRNQF